MIRILPYTKKTNKEEILNLYLYMVAASTPFYPEDVLDSEFFYPDGKTQLHLSKLQKHTRTRTPEYKQLLEKYVWESGEEKKEDRRKNDAILAKALIAEYTPKLHEFLYDDSSVDGHVNRRKLRTLLTTPVGLSINKDCKEFNPITASSKKDKNRISAMLLDNVFCYEKFSRQNEIYRLVEMLAVGVCPYCNRIFTTTASKGDKRVRPQLDHFRNKSDYPFLALSLLNLVPSCGVCNFLKGDKNEEILYPYEEEMGEKFIFQVEAKPDITALTGTKADISELTLSLVQKGADSTIIEHSKASISLFNLQEIYQSHRGYVADLLLQRYVFTDEMIRDIVKTYPNVFKAPEEVRELLVINNLEHDQWGERPLAKMTHDIIKELDELYNQT